MKVAESNALALSIFVKESEHWLKGKD